MRNGLHSSLQVIPGLEDEADWIALRDGVFDTVRPVGTLETEWTEQLASDLWMLRRCRRAKQAVILKNLHNLPSGYKAVQRMRGEFIEGDTEEEAEAFRRAAERRLVPDDIDAPNLERVETHTVRQIQKATAELRALQKARLESDAGKTWIEVRKSAESDRA